MQQIVGKPDDKNSSVPHTFSFLASQRKACNVLENISYYRINIEDKEHDCGRSHCRSAITSAIC